MPKSSKGFPSIIRNQKRHNSFHLRVRSFNTPQLARNATIAENSLICSVFQKELTQRAKDVQFKGPWVQSLSVTCPLAPMPLEMSLTLQDEKRKKAAADPGLKLMNPFVADEAALEDDFEWVQISCSKTFNPLWTKFFLSSFFRT